MKKATIIIIILIVNISCFCQAWTPEQLNQANTAKDISYLATAEKEAVLYINLARLFPQDFIANELQQYSPPLYGNSKVNSTYKRSLIVQLKGSAAVPPLYFDNDLYKSASCFAKESGDRGTVGHKRKNCPKTGSAECCSYGMDTGKDIAMQWLIDENVKGLGHRINCLNMNYSKIGISIHEHKKYGSCAVADIGW